MQLLQPRLHGKGGINSRQPAHDHDWNAITLNDQLHPTCKYVSTVSSPSAIGDSQSDVFAVAAAAASGAAATASATL